MPPTPPLTVTIPQARALLALVRHGPFPGFLDRHERKSLTHAADRLQAALDHGVAHPLIADLDRLDDVLCCISSREARDLLHSRARDLLATALLWSAAEELPVDARAEIIPSAMVIDDVAWRARVLRMLDAAGLRVSLPGDQEGGEEEEE